MRFRALETFASSELRSVYVAGQTYTARTDDCRAAVGAWVKLGRVEIIPDGQSAGMAGSGRPWWRRLWR